MRKSKNQPLVLRSLALGLGLAVHHIDCVKNLLALDGTL